ncbi:MAG: ABC transporter ATP-binding protein [Chloroflexi bacterium]|nr:ABC transporter ATP-binding protein [Chloroflexota bacterium]
MLQIQNISKTYQNAPLLRDLSFGIAPGEIVGLLGPSGAGKTTLLRIIAGLEDAEGGAVFFEGNSLRGIPPHARGFGFMFQDLALFPHRNVFDNVAFGLRMLTPTPTRTEITRRVNETLELVGLDAAAFARRDVNRLSGGEQQRVALARTLAPRPRLVMFDEPLGALDRILREELADELRALLKRLRMTALYVTHDQDEAFALADRLLLLNAGRIEQSGAPVEIYNHPASVFVARFLGLTNLVPIQKCTMHNAQCTIETAVGLFVLEKERGMEETPRFVLLRPNAVERIVPESLRRENTLRGRVVETQLRAGHQRIVVETRGGTFTFEWDGQVQTGADCVFELDVRGIQYLPERGASV